MFQNFSLKARLLMSFGLMSILIGAVGGVAFVAFAKLTEVYGQIASSTLPNAIALGELVAAEKDIVIGASNLLGATPSAAELKVQLDFMEKGRKDYEAASKAYLAIPFEPGEEELWKKVEAGFAPFAEMSKQIGELSSNGDKKEFAERDALGSKEYPELRKTARVALTNLIQFQSDLAKKVRAKAEHTATLAKSVIGVVASIGFALALVLGWFLSTSLSSLLRRISEQLASGAMSVSASAQQIAAASEELSAAVTEQASSLQETSASIEEINAMIARNAENAQTAAASSESAKANVHDGQEAMQKVSTSISHIQESNDRIAKQTETSSREFTEIVQVIGEIANKTKVINEIVFQTKLLSFNASVEAARAGEHGKGFAVVAEEVGNLAQMSGNAAKEISDMLASSMKRVETIVSKNKIEITTLVEAGKAEVDRGGHLAHDCAKVFDGIVHSVQEVDQMSSSISTASQEQKLGVQEVTRAVAQLSQVNSQNASASSQAASAAESLAAQSKELEELVRQLAHTVNGGARSATSAPAARHQQHKVIAFEERKAAKKESRAASASPAAEQAPRKAVAGDPIPSSDDPRFQDV